MSHSSPHVLLFLSLFASEIRFQCPRAEIWETSGNGFMSRKKNESYLWQKGKRKGEENVFIVKLLRDQTGASLGSPWDVKHQLTCTWCEIWIGQGFESSPNTNRVKSSSRSTSSNLRKEKESLSVRSGYASSHSKKTEEKMWVRKWQDVEMWAEDACGLPWTHARWKPRLNIILSQSWIQQLLDTCARERGPQAEREQHTLQLHISKHWVTLINQPTQCLWQGGIFKRLF